MRKYKVLIQGFMLDGVAKAEGDIIELSEEAAAVGVADGAIELVIDEKVE
jgi:hypothetical protein